MALRKYNNGIKIFWPKKLNKHRASICHKGFAQEQESQQFTAYRLSLSNEYSPITTIKTPSQSI